MNRCGGKWRDIHAGQASRRSARREAFGCGNSLRRPHEAVRVQRYGVDTLSNEESSEVGMIARCLATDADLDAGRVSLANGLGDHPRNGLVALVEQAGRSEEQTSELQSLLRISDAVFCLKKNRT